MKWTGWTACAGGLLLIWLLVIGAMSLARDQQASAEKVESLVMHTPLTVLEGEDREEYLERLARTVNRLDFESRREIGLRRVLDDSFAAMSQEERMWFLDETLPQGFEQIIERFNEMQPQERQAAVERAMADLQTIENNAEWEDVEQTRARLEDGTLNRVVREGFESYLKNATAETKLDLAPLIEQIQRNFQGLTYQ